jgi:hypothetical protein
MKPTGTPTPSLIAIEGYGQLSLSERNTISITGRKNAAGAWALVGTPDEVKELQAAGPAQTAAVVASAGSGEQALYAASEKGRSITGLSVSATGVYGTSTSGRGVEGWSQTNYGVTGDSQSFAGVRGTSVSAAGTEGWSTNNAGVFGTSTNGDGVSGISHSPNAAGIHGANDQGGAAARFDGTVQVNGNMNVSGDIVFAGGNDCAEHFDLVPGQQADAGSVVVVLEGGAIAPCFQAYDKRAAGVVSGAGSFRPAMILGGNDARRSQSPVALLGRVCCKADADIAPIEPGDLLTTSPTTGHAMKASDPARAFGAVIGKALGRLDSGKGLVPMLVCLQ